MSAPSANILKPSLKSKRKTTDFPFRSRFSGGMVAPAAIDSGNPEGFSTACFFSLNLQSLMLKRSRNRLFLCLPERFPGSDGESNAFGNPACGNQAFPSLPKNLILCRITSLMAASGFFRRAEGHAAIWGTRFSSSSIAPFHAEINSE